VIGSTFFSKPETTVTSSDKKPSGDYWKDVLDWPQMAEPRGWVPTIVVTATVLGLVQFYRSYLRRIPTTAHITPSYFRKRSLFGRVTSVGDGDNFHFFHTPGGRLAGWGWLRKVPEGKKEVKGQTVSIPSMLLSYLRLT
jgi:hypothetical protein